MSHTQNSFFGSACGRSPGRYHLLGLFLITSVLIAYFFRENQSTNTQLSKAPSNKRSPKTDFFSQEVRQKITTAIQSNSGHYSDFLSLMHLFASKIVRTGEVLLPTTGSAGVRYIPFPFCTFPKRRVQGPKEMEQQEEGRRWLKQRRDISKMTPKMFVSTLKVLNQKITGTPHHLHNFRSTVAWLKKMNIGLFSDLQKLTSVLDHEETKIAQNIQAKVNYIHNYKAIYAKDATENQQKETIMINLYQGKGNQFEQLAEATGSRDIINSIREMRLTAKEKRLVRKFYDIKVELTPAQQAELLEKDFEAFLKSDGDVITKAGLLHFMILKRHSFNDGNGRSAREMTNEFLEQHSLAPVFYPSREEYSKIASQSILADDPKILINYFRKHIDAKKYLESIALAIAMQDACANIQNDNKNCGEILDRVVDRSARGFC